MVRFHCYIPGEPEAAVRWGLKDQDRVLPEEAYEYHGVLAIEKAKISDAGTYICTSDTAKGPVNAPPAVLIVNAKAEKQEVEEVVHDEHEEGGTDDYGHETNGNSYGNNEDRVTNQEYEHGNQEYGNHEYGDNHEYGHGNNGHKDTTNNEEHRYQHGKCRCFFFSFCLMCFANKLQMFISLLLKFLKGSCTSSHRCVIDMEVMGMFLDFFKLPKFLG